MVWQAFKAVRRPDALSEDRIEIASALMLGGRFVQNKEGGIWSCIDDEPDSCTPELTGHWNFKVNAARAYLSIKGVFYDRNGVPMPHSGLRSPVSTLKGDRSG